jgi:hypothetical protein
VSLCTVLWLSGRTNFVVVLCVIGQKFGERGYSLRRKSCRREVAATGSRFQVASEVSVAVSARLSLGMEKHVELPG